MAEKKPKEALRFIRRKIFGGDPTHDRTEQGRKDAEIPRQLQEPKEPTKYNYLGERID